MANQYTIEPAETIVELARDPSSLTIKLLTSTGRVVSIQERDMFLLNRRFRTLVGVQVTDVEDTLATASSGFLTHGGVARLSFAPSPVPSYNFTTDGGLLPVNSWSDNQPRQPSGGVPSPTPTGISSITHMGNITHFTLDNGKHIMLDSRHLFEYVMSTSKTPAETSKRSIIDLSL